MAVAYRLQGAGLGTGVHEAQQGAAAGVQARCRGVGAACEGVMMARCRAGCRRARG
ncbi:hypothetical protein SLEP1_g43918 [Rubroshorea leprosula]|uniref:Uncharacterized protein n=1 Tax=Rubroshorea leprosula TaxID=152421 RepID=A0AAV5LEL2_9ROSI|nr:hypothetical protein SLEP1_g43918 [Rubroshorea leprosula]